METLTIRQSTTSGLDVMCILKEFENKKYDTHLIEENGGFTVEITLKRKSYTELHRLGTEIRQRLNQITQFPYTPTKKDNS